MMCFSWYNIDDYVVIIHQIYTIDGLQHIGIELLVTVAR